MRRLRLVLFAIALTASATAQETAPTPAEDLRTAGQVHLRMGRYEEALTALLAAYEAKPETELLLPISRCYAELRNWEKAAFFSGEYLRAPDAAERQTAEAVLAQAKDEIEREREMERLTRLLGPAASTTGGEVALASGDSSAVESVPLQAIATPAVAPSQRSSPKHRRWWIVCGASVLAIAAAGGAAAASSRPAERKTLPEGDLGTIDRRNP